MTHTREDKIRTAESKTARASGILDLLRTQPELFTKDQLLGQVMVAHEKLLEARIALAERRQMPAE